MSKIPFSCTSSVLRAGSECKTDGEMFLWLSGEGHRTLIPIKSSSRVYYIDSSVFCRDGEL